MSHVSFIDKWPSLAEFADDLFIAYGTAKAMKRRGSVPSQYWELMIDGAIRREIDGVTYEALALAVSCKDINSPAGSSAGEAGASSPPNPGAPANSCQGRAEVARLAHNQEVTGSNPVPATSLNSSGILPSGEAGARVMGTACAPASISGEGRQ